jgi:lipopolysaccharide/colanic/teichoic acid biosynthesis glycosyltransferase
LISRTYSASIHVLVRPDTGPSVGKLAVKRAADGAIAAFGLVILAPVLALLAIVIWLTDGSPVIFKSHRFGRGGRQFTMYKFRTMAVESASAQELSRNVAVGMVKIIDDPRVTSIGGVLRRSSLDELPQLWNVIRGDMSLVGPRPHDVGEVSLGDEATRRRLTMRPGLTGLWQVRARTNPSFDVRVKYDLDYVTQWSLLLDLAIAWETIPVLLRGEGGQVASLELDRA